MAKKQIPDAEEFVLTGNFVCVNKRQGHENSTKHKHHTNTQLTNLETLRYSTLSTFTFQSLDAGTQFSTKTIQAVKKKVTLGLKSVRSEEMEALRAKHYHQSTLKPSVQTIALSTQQ